MTINDYIVAVRSYLLDRQAYDNETLRQIVEDKIAYIEDTTSVPCKEFNKALQGVVVELTLLRLARLGSEGIEAQSFGGNSETLSKDIPAETLRVIRKNSKLKTV